MSNPITQEYRPAGRILAAAALAQRHLPRGKGAVPRCLGRAVGRRPLFLTTRHGARLAMTARAWDVYATITLSGGSWDYHDFDLCVNAMPDSGVFYDIGANVGYFSVEMVKRLGSGVRVVAFEPQPDLAAAITQSAALNQMNSIQVVQAIVGNTAQQAELYLAPAAIHASPVDDLGRPRAGVVRTRMVTIDDLVTQGQIPPPDMVKMDVEGSEHLVLRGAGNTFKEHRPHIFLEYWAPCDPGLRVRRQVQQFATDSGLELFGRAGIGVSSGRRYTFFRMRTEDDYQLVDGLFLRNTDRPVRDQALFEP